MTETYDKKTQEQRTNNFKKTLDEINKEYNRGQKTQGEVNISILGENQQADVEFISTGSLVLDNLLGGGFPKARVIEIFGPEASGKTSIALNAIADVQRKGGNALFIDAEQALDPYYASVLGVDTVNLGFTQISVLEQVMKIIRVVMQNGDTDIIVVDSIPALIPIAELEDPDKANIGLVARTLSKQLRIIVTLAKKHGTTIIFLNQIREKVGVMFGSPETTSGGRAMKFYASQRIEIRKKGLYKEGAATLGTEVRMKVVKNKVAPPYVEGSTVLTFAQGINREAEALTVGEELGIITKTGRTLFLTPTREIELNEPSSLEDDGRVKIATSNAAAIQALKDSPDLFNYITNAITHEMKIVREQNISNILEEIEDEVIEEFEAFDDVE